MPGMNRALALPLLVGLALSGCVTFRTVADGIDRARIGQTISRGGITVMPLGIVEDSRCPVKVTCIQAGTVRITAEVGGARTELRLDQSVAVPGGTVSLVEVYPTRRADTTYYPDEFRFGFRIGR